MILSSQIARKFGLSLIGKDQIVKGISNPEDPMDNQLYWTRSKEFGDKLHRGILIKPKSLVLDDKYSNVTFLETDLSPRLIFAKVVNDFFPKLFIDDLTNFADDYRIDRSIIIGDNCFIGKNVIIGKGSIIHPNVVIYKDSVIGENCEIMSNASIGSTGIGFERDGAKMYKFPQIGNVIIGNDVEIGPNTTIRRGALGSTVIGNQVKVGSLTNIGHNCIIEERVLITGNCTIAGSSKIGKDVFVGVGVIIKNKVEIGSNSTIGMGALIITDVPNNETWVGVPAKRIK